MATCEDCGEDHVEAAARAAIALEEILRLMADPGKKLSPTVIFHITGLLGALLIHYSPYELTDITEEVRRIAEDQEAVEGMHRNLVALGILGDEVNPGAAAVPRSAAPQEAAAAPPPDTEECDKPT